MEKTGYHRLYGIGVYLFELGIPKYLVSLPRAVPLSQRQQSHTPIHETVYISCVYKPPVHGPFLRTLDLYLHGLRLTFLMVNYPTSTLSSIPTSLLKRSAKLWSLPVTAMDLRETVEPVVNYTGKRTYQRNCSSRSN